MVNPPPWNPNTNFCGCHFPLPFSYRPAASSPHPSWSWIMQLFYILPKIRDTVPANRNFMGPITGICGLVIHGYASFSSFQIIHESPLSALNISCIVLAMIKCDCFIKWWTLKEVPVSYNPGILYLKVIFVGYKGKWQSVTLWRYSVNTLELCYTSMFILKGHRSFGTLQWLTCAKWLN